MRCEKSITLLWIGYLVHSLSKCAITLPTKIGLTIVVHKILLPYIKATAHIMMIKVLFGL